MDGGVAGESWEVDGLDDGVGVGVEYSYGSVEESATNGRLVYGVLLCMSVYM